MYNGDINQRRDTMSKSKRVSKVLQVVREDRMFAHKVEPAGRGKGSYSRKSRDAKSWKVALE